MKPLPETHQELFEWAIKNRVAVISEFLQSHEYYRLREWALQYAYKHELVAPCKLDEYGIYYPPDTERLAELKELGISYSWPAEGE